MSEITPGPQPVARRTQEERSHCTRDRILKAAIACLLERGYAQASTPEICRRAGMSRGALLHHFSGKAELMVRAVGQLAEHHHGPPLAPLPQVAGPVRAVEQRVEQLLSSFSPTLFHAALELWMGAKGDEELRRVLQVRLQSDGPSRLQRLWMALPTAAQGSHAGDAHLDDLLALTLHLLRGLALQQLIDPAREDGQRLLTLWRTIVRREAALARASAT